MAAMRFVYFSWIREKIGKGEEEIDIPSSVETVADLLSFMKTLGEEYQAALKQEQAVRVALDMEHVHHTEKLGTPHEIALFPPMTGG